MGTDEDEVTSILSTHTYLQRREMVKNYPQMFGKVYSFLQIWENVQKVIVLISHSWNPKKREKIFLVTLHKKDSHQEKFCKIPDLGPPLFFIIFRSFLSRCF